MSQDQGAAFRSPDDLTLSLYGTGIELWVDHLAIVDNLIIKSVSNLFVCTDTYRFTRYGQTWPRPGGTIARPASSVEIERLKP